MKRKICVVTGARSDFGLLRFLMEDIKSCPLLELQVIVTGMHLLQEFGLTYKEIEKSFNIDFKVNTLLDSDTAVEITRSMGYGLIGMAEALDRLRILPEKLKSKDFHHIDISQPNDPILEMNTLPKEAINKIMMFLSHPVADLLKRVWNI